MDKEAYAALKYGAIAGAIVVLLWIIYNGIDEGFKATPREMLGYIAVLILLALNAALLSREFAKYFTAAGNVLFSLWFAYDGITRALAIDQPWGNLSCRIDNSPRTLLVPPPSQREQRNESGVAPNRCKAANDPEVRVAIFGQDRAK
jgi:hypothetical protein